MNQASGYSPTTHTHSSNVNWHRASFMHMYAQTHIHTQLVPVVAVGAEIGKKMANVSVCDRQPEAVWGTTQFSDRCCHHTSVTSSSPQHTVCMLGRQECRWGNRQGCVHYIYMFVYCDSVCYSSVYVNVSECVCVCVCLLLQEIRHLPNYSKWSILRWNGEREGVKRLFFFL